MAIEELPASHPYVTNEPLDMSEEAVQLRRRRPVAITKPHNPAPPSDWSSRRRKGFLWNNLGYWGLIFQVMYAGKALYEECKAVSYQEIHVDARNLDYDDQDINDKILLSGLKYQVLRDHTKYVVVELTCRQPTATILNLVEAFRNIKSLQHIRLAWRGNEPTALESRTGTDQNILKFFDLDVETITIMWEWYDRNHPFDNEPDIFYGPNGEEWITTVAAMRMEDMRADWLKETYELSI